MSDGAGTPLLDGKAIREALAGYAVAAEYIERERIERLRRLGPEESWQIFLDLLETGRMFLGEDNALAIFDLRQVESLLHLRQVLDKAAQVQKAI